MSKKTPNKPLGGLMKTTAFNLMGIGSMGMYHQHQITLPISTTKSVPDIRTKMAFTMRNTVLLLVMTVSHFQFIVILSSSTQLLVCIRHT